jgi:hypothetical protein
MLYNTLAGIFLEKHPGYQKNKELSSSPWYQKMIDFHNEDKSTSLPNIHPWHGLNSDAIKKIIQKKLDSLSDEHQKISLIMDMITFSFDISSLKNASNDISSLKNASKIDDLFSADSAVADRNSVGATNNVNIFTNELNAEILKRP